MSSIEVWFPITDGSLANAASGAVIDLSAAEWADLAVLRQTTIAARSILAESAALLDAEVARRLDLANERHRLVGDVDLRVNAPQETHWDVERLREALDQLVNEGRLGGGVPGRAVKTEVSYKPVARELAKLISHDDPRVRELIEECRQVVPAKRRVTITEAEGAHARSHRH